MRALILAAGLGERMRPLSNLLPKPALPVRGLPVIGYSLRLLAHHGIREVVINLHHLPDALRASVERWCPTGMQLHWSVESELLGTGGAIRRVADFLHKEDPCLLLAGDMLLDADLSRLIESHRSRGDSITFLLRDDPRAPLFGTIGVDAHGEVRRIGRCFDRGKEVRAGIYAHATVISARALETLPERSAFNHLEDWVAPALADGMTDVRGEVWSTKECVWEPVGTPAEYLQTNLHPPELSYVDREELTRETGTRCEGSLVVGPGVSLGQGCRLENVVVWEGETVPAGLQAKDGVFAGGEFHACGSGAEAC